jgi:tRNA pseudouridine13 synthase
MYRLIYKLLYTYPSSLTNPLPLTSFHTTQTITTQAIIIEDGTEERTMDQAVETFHSIVPDSKQASRLRSFFQAAAANDRSATVLLGPVPDKEHRTAIHKLFKMIKGMPPLDSRNVEDTKVLMKQDSGGKLEGTDGTEVNKHTIEVFVGQSYRTNNIKKRGRKNSDMIWPGGDRSYLRFLLYKENTDSQAALSSIASAIHVNHKCFAVAGTKDKRGVTVQAVTAYKTTPARLLQLNKGFRHMMMGNFEYVPEQLGLGDLKGNRFEIMLRNIHILEEDTNDNDNDKEKKAVAVVVDTAVQGLRAHGFINYFGLQRFGTGTIPTHHVGRALLRGEWGTAINLILTPHPETPAEIVVAIDHYVQRDDARAALNSLPNQHRGGGGGGRYTTERALLTVLAKQGANAKVNALMALPRNLRTLYIHAYQSYLFNMAASERVKRYGSKVVVTGDLVLPRDIPVISEASSAAATASAAAAVGVVDEFVPQMMIDDDNDNDDSKDLSQQERQAKRRATAADIFDKVHIVTAEEAEQGIYSIEDVVLPVPGGKIIYPDNEIGGVYKMLAAQDGVSLDSCPHGVREFSSVEAGGGAYRRLMHKPENVEHDIVWYDNPDEQLLTTDVERMRKRAIVEGGGGGGGGARVEKKGEGRYLGLRLAFDLPASCYATMLIRELTKMETNKNHQAQLQH